MDVPDVERMLTEIVRVARSRGRIGVVDCVWNTMIVEQETTQTIPRTFSDAMRWT